MEGDIEDLLLLLVIFAFNFHPLSRLNLTRSYVVLFRKQLRSNDSGQPMFAEVSQLLVPSGALSTRTIITGSPLIPRRPHYIRDPSWSNTSFRPRPARFTTVFREGEKKKRTNKGSIVIGPPLGNVYPKRVSRLLLLREFCRR